MAVEDVSITGWAAGRHAASHPNPAYDYLSGFAPRKVKDLMRWVEYLFYASPAVFAALMKFASYAVTTVRIDEEGVAKHELWSELLEKKLDVKGNAITTNIDRRLYGNSMMSVYKPFDRFLVCEACKKRTNIVHVQYKFQLKTLKFKYTCKACDKSTTGSIHDEKSKDLDRISLIRWDPKLMDIHFNPITGKSEYYYTIPNVLRTQVEKGDPHIINGMPIEFLRAVQENKSFKFAPGQIYHMKMPGPAGTDAAWGMPPLASTIKLFFYTAVLRKANEAIALDHIVPFRVLHPAAISGTADPAMQINLANWQSKMEQNIKQWRRDPLHIMFAPTALGVTMMGGQGRSLMTLGEIKEAEDSIIAAFGVPREFIYGGMTVQGSAISLRMLENQLETDAAQMNDQLAWIVKQVADVLGWKPVKASFLPFRLVDDAEQKMLMMNLQQALGGPLSKGTMLESLPNIDLAKERQKRTQEMLDDARADAEAQAKLMRLQTSAAQQAQQAAQAGQGLGYNPQAVLAQADQMVQQLMSLDPGSKQSQMDHLSQEDPVMYAVVKDRMEANAQMMRQQAASSAGVSSGMQG